MICMRCNHYIRADREMAAVQGSGACRCGCHGPTEAERDALLGEVEAVEELAGLVLEWMALDHWHTDTCNAPGGLCYRSRDAVHRSIMGALASPPREEVRGE